jgi:hypothetical protein
MCTATCLSCSHCDEPIAEHELVWLELPSGAVKPVPWLDAELEAATQRTWHFGCLPRDRCKLVV